MPTKEQISMHMRLRLDAHGNHEKAVQETCEWYASQSAPPRKPCTWRNIEQDGFWQTDCDSAFVFIDDGPKENSMNYCHNCGNPVRVEETSDAD